MTTVQSGLTKTGALSSVNAPWKNKILLMPDSYRAIVYVDNTGNVVVTASANGSGSWSVPTTILAGTYTGFLPVMHAISAGNAVWFFLGNGSAVTAYKLPYSGAGAWGAVTSASVAVGLTSSVLSVRAVYDAAASTIDSGHTAGTTGIIHCLVDTGTTWNLYALDPNNSTAPCKVTLSTSQTTGLTGPTGMTALILRAPNKLYAVTPGQSAWYACEFTYTSAVTSGGSVTTQTFNAQRAVAMGFAGSSYNGGQYFWPNAGGGQVYTGQVGGVSFATDSTSSHPTSSEAIPAGTWNFTFGMAVSGPNPTGGGTPLTFEVSAQVYEQTSAGAMNLLGTAPFGVPVAFNSFGSATANTSVSLPAFNLGAGSQLMIELIVNFSLSSFQTSGTMYWEGGTATAPSTSSVAVNSYTAGAPEAPAITLSSNGAALCLGDTTANPAIDLFVSDGAQIWTQQRNNSGGYATKLTLPGTSGIGLITDGVSAAQNSSNGTEAVFYMATFSGTSHIGMIQKTGGTWGAPARLDNGISTDQPAFITVGVSSLGAIGSAIAYLDGASPYDLHYEDSGFSAASQAPQAQNPALIGSGIGTSVSPFSVDSQNTVVTVSFLYACPTANDRLGSYQAVISHGGTTDSDTGRIGVVNGPLPGSVFTFTLPIPNLSLYVNYTVTINVWETAGGTESSAPGTVQFMLVDRAVIAQVTTAITDITQSLQFDYFHSQLWEIIAYDVNLGTYNSSTGLYGPIQINGQPQYAPSLLQFDAAAGQPGISTTTALAVGQVISLGTAGTGLGYTVTACTGSGPYTVTLDQNLAATFSARSQVNVRITTPATTFFPALSASGTTIEQIIVWSQPPSTGLLGGAYDTFLTFPLALTPPEAPAVTDLYCDGIVGGDPLHGGYVLMRGLQPTPTGNQIEAASWNLYQKRSNADDWQLVKNVPAHDGLFEFQFYSIPNDKEMDFAVEPVSTNGIIAPKTTYTNVSLTFRVGIWFNDPDNPSTCLEIGFHVAVTSAYPFEFETQTEKDLATLFNRTAPVLTTGTMAALHSSTNPILLLEDGWEEDSMNLLRSWNNSGKTLLIRTMWGHVFYGAILTLKESAEQLAAYQTAQPELQQVDPGPYTLLMV